MTDEQKEKARADRQQQADDSKPAQKQGGMVGIKCGPAGIVAWCFGGCHVICEARELGPMSWSISGRVNGTERIYAVVQGGKWATSTYLRLIRNGLVARCRRLKRKRANYAARMAAEATASVQQQEATASVQQQEAPDTVARQMEE